MQEMTVFEKPRKSSLQQRRRQSSDYEWVDHLVLKGIVKKKSKYLGWSCFYKRGGIAICKGIEIQWFYSCSWVVA